MQCFREVSPTLHFNVPRGFDMLLPFLERDAALRESFFRDLDLLFYAAAALPQSLWERLERVARQQREPVAAVHMRFEKDGTLSRIASHIQTEKTLNYLFEHARKTA